MSLQQAFFAYFAVVMVALSIMVVTRRNPVHSVLWMLVLFFHIAGVYLFLNSEFLASVQIILYAGAILVLFVFVVMMLNIKTEINVRRFIGQWPVALATGVSMLSFIVFAIANFVQGPKGTATISFIKEKTSTKAIGTLLYTEYILPFEIASLVLLIAVVGAIVLAKKRKKEE